MRQGRWQVLLFAITRLPMPAVGLLTPLSQLFTHGTRPGSSLGYGVLYNGMPLRPDGPGGVLVLKPGGEPGPRIMPAEAPITAAGVYRCAAGAISLPSGAPTHPAARCRRPRPRPGGASSPGRRRGTDCHGSS
jgi:hypothetical protein